MLRQTRELHVSAPLALLFVKWSLASGYRVIAIDMQFPEISQTLHDWGHHHQEINMDGPQH